MKTRRSNLTTRSAILAGPRSGGVLALAMIVVLTVAALAAGMLQLSTAVTRRQVSAVNTKLSFYMAEAGLTEAYAGLTSGHTGNVGSEAAPVAFGEGLFWVEATDNLDGTTTLRSTGMTGNGRAVLSFVVKRESVSAASLGIFGVDGLTVSPGVTLDGFDSHEAEAAAQVPVGEPAPPPAPTLGRLSSNGPITITGTERAPVLIDGDVTTGPGLTAQIDGAVTITGATSTALAVIEPKPVEVPDATLSAGVLVEGWAPYTVLPGKTALASLSVAAGAEAVIEGPATLLVGTLRVQSEGQLTFDVTNGEVSVIVLENLSFDAGSFVNTNAVDTRGVSIQVAGPSVRPVLLAAESDFMGVVYAPESDVQVFEGFEVFGALVGKTLQFNGAVGLHYDVFLDRLAAELSLPELVSWRIIELSNPSISVGADPFVAMGVTRASLSPPDDAHEDQTIRIKYLDGVGTPLTYSGLESGFDWDLVDTVNTLFRDGEEIDVDAAVKRTQNSDLQTFDTP